MKEKQYKAYSSVFFIIIFLMLFFILRQHFNFNLFEETMNWKLKKKWKALKSFGIVSSF